MPHMREALSSIMDPVQTGGGVTNLQAQQVVGRGERSEVQSQLQLCSKESEASQGCMRPNFKARQRRSSDKASSPSLSESGRHMSQLAALKVLPAAHRCLSGSLFQRLPLHGVEGNYQAKAKSLRL